MYALKHEGIIREIDQVYTKQATGCEKNDIPYGVCAFCRFTSVEDAKVEARDFYKRSMVNGHKPLFFVADVEVKTMNNMRAGTNAFIAELRRLGSEKVGIYVAHHLHDSFNLDYSKADFKWIPRYASDGKSVIKPRFECDLHQYTDRGKIAGINGGVDLNILTGSKALKWFIGSDSKNPTKPTSQKTIRYTVTADQLNIRKAASNSGKILGQLKKKDTVQVVSIDKNGWAKIKSNNTYVYVHSTYLIK